MGVLSLLEKIHRTSRILFVTISTCSTQSLGGIMMLSSQKLSRTPGKMTGRKKKSKAKRTNNFKKTLSSNSVIRMRSKSF